METAIEVLMLRAWDCSKRGAFSDPVGRCGKCTDPYDL